MAGLAGGAGRAGARFLHRGLHGAAGTEHPAMLTVSFLSMRASATAPASKSSTSIRYRLAPSSGSPALHQSAQPHDPLTSPINMGLGIHVKQRWPPSTHRSRYWLQPAPRLAVSRLPSQKLIRPTIPTTRRESSVDWIRTKVVAGTTTPLTTFIALSGTSAVA